MADTKKKTTTKKAAAPKAAAPAAPAAKPVAPVAKPAAPAPVVKPAPVVPAAKPAAPVAKPASKQISSDERDRMIREAAYYLAEQRGFQGDPHDDWVAAEKQIDAELISKNIRVG